MLENKRLLRYPVSPINHALPLSIAAHKMVKLNKLVNNLAQK